MDEHIEQGIFCWLLLVSFVGATVSYLSKYLPKNKDEKVLKKIIFWFRTILTSEFVGYITFAITEAMIESRGVRIAISGLASYLGIDLLQMVETHVYSVLKDKIENITKKL